MMKLSLQSIRREGAGISLKDCGCKYMKTVMTHWVTLNVKDSHNAS